MGDQCPAGAHWTGLGERSLPVHHRTLGSVPVVATPPVPPTTAWFRRSRVIRRPPRLPTPMCVPVQDRSIRPMALPGWQDRLGDRCKRGRRLVGGAAQPQNGWRWLWLGHETIHDFQQHSERHGDRKPPDGTCRRTSTFWSVTPPPAGSAYAVTTDYVNVRTGPGTNYPVLGVAAPGASAAITGKSSDGAWWQVQDPDSVFRERLWLGFGQLCRCVQCRVSARSLGTACASHGCSHPASTCLGLSVARLCPRALLTEPPTPSGRRSRPPGCSRTPVASPGIVPPMTSFSPVRSITFGCIPVPIFTT